MTIYVQGNDLLDIIEKAIVEELQDWRSYLEEIRKIADHQAFLERERKAIELRVYKQQHTLDDVKILCVQRGYHRKINQVRGEIRKLTEEIRSKLYVDDVPEDDFVSYFSAKNEELDMKCIQMCYEWAEGDDVLANDILRACDLINDAYYHRLGRLQNRVERMCNIGCCFLTLTFDEVQLGIHSPEILRKRVQQYLNGFDVPYIANVDYGALNGRLHYHAVICAPLEQLSLEPWKRGYCYYEEVGSNRVFRVDKGIYERSRKRRDDTPEDNGARTSRYMNKLTNHALKETARGSNIMYCRGIDEKLTALEQELFTKYMINLYERQGSSNEKT